MTQDEKKQKVSEYIHKTIESNIKKYPGILMGQSEEDLFNSMGDEFPNLTYEAIVLRIDNEVQRRIEEIQKYDTTVVNDFVYYESPGETLQFHITASTPKDLRKIARNNKKKVTEFLSWVGEDGGLLDDAFKKIAKDIKEKKFDVKTISAVSPMLALSDNGIDVKEYFINNGFDYRLGKKGEFAEKFPGKQVGMVNMDVSKFLERYGKDAPVIEAVSPEVLREMQKQVLPEIYANENNVLIEKTMGQSIQNEKAPKDLE